VTLVLVVVVEFKTPLEKFGTTGIAFAGATVTKRLKDKHKQEIQYLFI
tara:strand:- start:580 stop:723 length:144 start_codon:yes stop_codon:yes gene_type:complete